MARCNLCNKETSTSEPMVLAGNCCFIQGAGNGHAWVAQAPSVRYWKTFALLEVSICPECRAKEQGKFFNKLFKKDIRKALLDKYKKAKKIPGDVILALPKDTQKDTYEDLPIKENMMATDPWLGPNFTQKYDLTLYTESELDKIGTIPLNPIAGDAWNYAPAQGVEEARQAAIDLFNHRKNK